MADTPDRLRELADAAAAELLLVAPGGGLAPVNGPLAELQQTLTVLLELESDATEKARLNDFLRHTQTALADLAAGGNRLGEHLSTLQAALAAPRRAATPAAVAPAPVVTTVEAPVTDREMFFEFFSEASEHIESFERVLMRLEADPAQREAVNEGFRNVHTIKGMAGFLNLNCTSQLSHAMESMLDLMRAGAVPEADGLALLFQGIDLLKYLIHRQAEQLKTGTLPTLDAAAFTALLGRLAAATARLQDGARAPAGETAAAAPPTIPGAQMRDTENIRVNVKRIDQLVNSVGELVITFNQLRQAVEGELRERRQQKNLSQMVRIVAGLQDDALSLRMLPLAPAFQRLNRLARDLAKKLGKQVEVQVTGGETELDRTVIEEIQDPLVHIVRNTLDHGIEPPEEREDRGKPAAGNVSFAAWHQSGNVVIEITDDGRGLDREKILRKARERGLIAPDATPPDAEIFRCIFLPGFSTAEKVTDVSGRGVGMDVVKRNLDKLRGKIDIRSAAGQGTTITLRIPLTLAIIDGMIVRVASERFIVPMVSIIESVRVKAAQFTEVPGQGNVVSLREALIPFVDLRALLRLPAGEAAAEMLVMIIQGTDRQFCVRVDELLGQQQVVIKSLGRALKRHAGFAGAAIMGDGRVGLILDPEQLAGLAA